MTEKIYDIIIVGAGPAGLLAARTLIKNSCGSILLLDKTAPWENTVPCAEGVGKLGFHESASPIRPSWIRHEVTSATFHAPSGSSITYVDKHGGYIIDRTRMQADLAEEIATRGVTCLFHHTVVNIAPPVNGLRTVVCTDGSTHSGRVIIDASGPVTRFGREEKIQVQHDDLEPAYFVWADNVIQPSDHIHIYAGQEIAPGGYAWVFPRGEGGANIGIVLGKARGKQVNIRTLLDNFISVNYPGAHVVRRFAGPIPCAHQRSLPMAVAGFIKAGDSASTVNPISRAGISEAMLSGCLAAEAACTMLNASSARERNAAARTYAREWNRRRGTRHGKLSRVKNSLRSIPDTDYNSGADALSAITPAEMTMSKIFRASLSRFPRLVWALRHLM